MITITNQKCTLLSSSPNSLAVSSFNIEIRYIRSAIKESCNTDWLHNADWLS